MRMVETNKELCKLAMIRKEKGITQKKLSELSGVSLSMIQKFEQGSKGISIDTMIKLANALRVDITQIFDIDENLLSNLYSDRIQTLKKMDNSNIDNSENEFYEAIQELMDTRANIATENKEVFNSIDGAITGLLRSVSNSIDKRKVKSKDTENFYKSVDNLKNICYA